MRIAVTALGAALTLLALGACSSAGGGGSTSSTLVVGEFNPFSGPDAAFGPEMVGGCVPAVRVINSSGGVLGHQLSCVQEDTRGDPADAVPAAQKMMATETSLIGVLGPSSDEALATVPLLNQGHVPMFADTGQAAFDRTHYAYFYRITPADDVKGYAMALWAHKAGYTRAAAVFGNDAGAQSDVPTLVRAFTKLGGTIVYNKPLALDQSSYRAEIENMLAAHPQVIFTEVDPQTGATFLSELQQLHGLLPVVGTEVTLQAPWLKAVNGAIGASAMAKYFEGMQPYAPPSGPGLAGLQPVPAGVGIAGAQAQPVEHRPVLDDLLRRGQRDGAGCDRGQEHQPEGLQPLHREGHRARFRQDGRHHVRGGEGRAEGRQADPVHRRGRAHRVQPMAQLDRGVRGREIREGQPGAGRLGVGGADRIAQPVIAPSAVP